MARTRSGRLFRRARRVIPGGVNSPVRAFGAVGGTPPFLDVYRGVAMSSVGILAWKSALEDGRPFDVPDFRDEA